MKPDTIFQKFAIAELEKLFKIRRSKRIEGLSAAGLSGQTDGGNAGPSGGSPYSDKTDDDEEEIVQEANIKRHTGYPPKIGQGSYKQGKSQKQFTVLWYQHPRMGLRIIDHHGEDAPITHAEWMKQEGVPDHAFDKLPRGRIHVDKRVGLVKEYRHVGRSTPDKVLDHLNQTYGLAGMVHTVHQEDERDGSYFEKPTSTTFLPKSSWASRTSESDVVPFSGSSPITFTGPETLPWNRRMNKKRRSIVRESESWLSGGPVDRTQTGKISIRILDDVNVSIHAPGRILEQVEAYHLFEQFQYLLPKSPMLNTRVMEQISSWWRNYAERDDLLEIDLTTGLATVTNPVTQNFYALGSFGSIPTSPRIPGDF